MGSMSSDFPEFILLDSCCYFRKVYRDVIPLGQSVLEANNQQASNEIINLLKEIFSYDNNKKKS